MALMLGALMIHGITPGPPDDRAPRDLLGADRELLDRQRHAGLLNIPLIGMWVRLLKIPYHFLYPAIIVLICIGVYSDQQQRLRCRARAVLRLRRLRHAAARLRARAAADRLRARPDDGGEFAPRPHLCLPRPRRGQVEEVLREDSK
jgi:hypothetical protein